MKLPASKAMEPLGPQQRQQKTVSRRTWQNPIFTQLAYRTNAFTASYVAICGFVLGGGPKGLGHRLVFLAILSGF